MIAVVLIIVFLITLNALYVAAEFGAVSARRTKIREAAEGGHRTARWILRVLDNAAALDRYVACCQIGITLSSLVLGAYGQVALAPRIADLIERVFEAQPAAAFGIASTATLLGLTGLQVVLGELVPKSVALQYPTPTVLYTALPMRASLWVLRPLIAILNGSGIAILRAVGAPAGGHRHIHSPDEIALLIAESHDGGLLSRDEQERLERALRLSLLPVRRLMVPRLDIVGADEDWTLAQVQEQFAASNFTRLPVYRGSLDRITGIVHAKEAARRIAQGERDLRVRDLMRPIAHVPESMRAERLVGELRRQRSEQAVVVDEHGGVAGLVTVEDLLVELLSDSRALHPGEEAPEPLPDGRVRLPGRLRVDDVHAWVGVAWDGESDTVGGLVTERLGHIPSSGERLTIAGVDVEVEEVDAVTVRSVLATPVLEVAPGGSS